MDICPPVSGLSVFYLSLKTESQSSKIFRFSRGEKKGNLWDQRRPVENQVSLENRVVQLVQSDQYAFYELPFVSVAKLVFPLQVLFRANETRFHMIG